MTVIVKENDTHTTRWVANIDLSGATVRLLARDRSTNVLTVLACTVTDAPGGEVTHTLTGTLPVAVYRVELEVTQGAVITTFPNESYETLAVVPDLD